MIKPDQDGVTHINIYSQGKTELGRMLSNFYKYKIITKDGIFNSVEAYWHWLGLKDCKEKESYKLTYGYNAKKLGTDLKKQYGEQHIDDFKKKILNAIWYKAKRNSYLFKPEITNLPFEHYYNFGGKIVNVKDKYLWMINGIDKMRNYILKKVNE